MPAGSNTCCARARRGSTEQANAVAVLRDQNRRLNEEADHLAELVRLS
jgi:hypothetical protein